MKWKSLQDAILDIEKRPAMFIGGNSVFDLYTFITGYEFSLSVHNIQGARLFDDSLSFHDWVALRTHFYESTSGWANMLAEYYGSEEKALKMFFIHYREYKSRTATLIKYLIINERKKWKTSTINGQEHISYLTPSRIEVLKYTNDPGMFIRFLGSSNNLIDREEYAFNEKSLNHRLLNISFSETDWKNI
jgi:hypothetical protein